MTLPAWLLFLALLVLIFGVVWALVSKLIERRRTVTFQHSQ